jgi:hypothetical protein
MLKQSKSSYMPVRTLSLLASLAISCALTCGAADSGVYPYSWDHPRLVEVQLMDDTDRHDELYFEKEYLLSRCEKPFDVSAPALFIEDSLTGEGLPSSARRRFPTPARPIHPTGVWIRWEGK